jgi:eukaryotic-like serine/threonine-protein kinase
MLEVMKCPVCDGRYDPPTKFCVKDGATLEVCSTLIGRVLSDRYRIDSLLGVGGMGTVYRATHILLESEFAVKVLDPELMTLESLLERFKLEAKAARRIRHPNAIEVTDFGVTEDRLVYLVMEIVDGHLLRDLMAKGPIEKHRAVKLLSQVCAAVDYAHKSGVIHRDLKPDNIIVKTVGDEERVKVLDFGIAKLLVTAEQSGPRRVLTKAGTVIGTPQYMSPEQCQGKELQPTSDIYSLGIIAYEMLSGRPIFQCSNPIEYLAKHLRETPTPLRLIAPSVPPSLSDVVMRALDKDPTLRQQSAVVLATQLHQAVNEPWRESQGAQVVDAQTVPLSGWKKTISLFRTTVDQPAVKIPADQPQPLTAPIPQESTAPKWRWSLIAGVAALAIAAGLLVHYGPRFRSGSVGGTNPESTPKAPTSPTSKPAEIVDEYGKMILIPGGTFKMGRDDGSDDERPAHDVEVKDFYLDETEVTNQQYKKFVDAKGYRPPSSWTDGSYAPGKDQFPVTQVTWRDAYAYALWAHKRLPTEAQWEYAARGGNNDFLYPWGNDWKDGNANVGKALAPVKSFENDRSTFGIYDMAGNVSEWVDGVRTNYKNEQTIGCGTCRVYRGGNYADVKPSFSSSTFRREDYLDFDQVPSASDLKTYRKTTMPVVGFRCAK